MEWRSRLQDCMCASTVGEASHLLTNRLMAMCAFLR